MPSAEPDEAAAAAAARRGRKGAPASTVSAAPDPVPTGPVSDAPAAPPEEIMVARSVVAEHVLRADGGRAFGDPSIYTAILGPGSAVPLHGDYVHASCDVYETMIPPRATTSVERLLWRRGWLIRADVHAAVLAAHAAAVEAGTAGVAQPASLDVAAADLAPPLAGGSVVVPPTGYVGAPAHG